LTQKKTMIDFSKEFFQNPESKGGKFNEETGIGIGIVDRKLWFCR